MLRKTLFNLGVSLRNPSIKHWLRFFKEADSWDLQQIEAYQFKKLKELLTVAYNHSSYYKKVFDTHKLHPDAIKKVSDITLLPTLTKLDAIAFSKEIHTNVKFKKRFKASTSGSTGKPLVFMREELADSFNRASIFHNYKRFNVKPWERNGYFWGFGFSLKQRLKTRFLDFLQNRFRLFSFNDANVNRFVKKLKKASYLHGYSSMVYQTAKFINTQKLPKPKGLKMVKGTSEKIYGSYQEEIIKAFGKKMISEYGAAETGIIAFECAHGFMHLNSTGCIVEEVNNEILVTNLQQFSFPVIRYKLGDYIKLAEPGFTCACGSQYPVLQEVTGRVGENVYGKKGTYPSLYFYYIFKNLAKNGVLVTYQVVQRKPGFLEFYIEEALDTHKRLLLEKEIRAYFKKDIEFSITSGVQNGFNSKKNKSFISYI